MNVLSHFWISMFTSSCNTGQEHLATEHPLTIRETINTAILLERKKLLWCILKYLNFYFYFIL